MNTLSAQQVQQFNQDGFLFLENAIAADTLPILKNEFEQWVEESRHYSEPYGTTVDKRPRFDIEPGHCAEKPALRRVPN